MESIAGPDGAACSRGAWRLVARAGLCQEIRGAWRQGPPAEGARNAGSSLESSARTRPRVCRRTCALPRIEVACRTDGMRPGVRHSCQQRFPNSCSCHRCTKTMIPCVGCQSRNSQDRQAKAKLCVSAGFLWDEERPRGQEAGQRERME